LPRRCGRGLRAWAAGFAAWHRVSLEFLRWKQKPATAARTTRHLTCRTLTGTNSREVAHSCKTAAINIRAFLLTVLLDGTQRVVRLAFTSVLSLAAFTGWDMTETLQLEIIKQAHQAADATEFWASAIATLAGFAQEHIGSATAAFLLQSMAESVAEGDSAEGMH